MKPTPTLERHRAPEPERPFVNRQTEREIIADRIRAGIQGGPMPSAVVCFWGAFGMGKSWLLLEMEREPLPRELVIDADALLASASHPPISARLDLDRETNPSLWIGQRLDRARLVRELWKQLAERLGVQVPAEDEASPEDWANRFVQQVTAWSSHSVTPLLLLDSVDDMLRWDEMSFGWLEQEIVERLAMTDRVLFAFTSRSELRRWQRFHVRRRVQSCRLGEFDVQTTASEVKAPEAVGPLLYRHAFGHPLATDFLRQAIERQGVVLDNPNLIQEVLKPPLVLDALQHTSDEFLADVPSQLRPLAKAISVLRRVRAEQLRSLIAALGPDQLVPAGTRDMDDVIDQLQACHLLYWNSSRKTDEMDAVVRQILAYRLELDDSSSFLMAHRAAYRLQRDQLSRYPDNLDRYVPELVYHHAVLAARGQVSPEPDLGEWWDQFETERAPREAAPWDALGAALDEDDELKKQSPGAWEKLRSAARQHGSEGSGPAEGGTDHD